MKTGIFSGITPCTAHFHSTQEQLFGTSYTTDTAVDGCTQIVAPTHIHSKGINLAHLHLPRNRLPASQLYVQRSLLRQHTLVYMPRLAHHQAHGAIPQPANSSTKHQATLLLLLLPSALYQHIWQLYIPQWDCTASVYNTAYSHVSRIHSPVTAHVPRHLTKRSVHRATPSLPPRTHSHHCPHCKQQTQGSHCQSRWCCQCRLVPHEQQQPLRVPQLPPQHAAQRRPAPACAVEAGGCSCLPGPC
jgi:hypothetical protein